MRARILAEAKSLIAVHGFRATPIASIAEQSGLTLPGLLYYFPSKRDLLMELLEEQSEFEQDWWEELSEQGVSRVELLERIVQRNRTREEDVRFFVTMVAEGTSPEHPAHEYFRERYARVRTFLAEYLDEGKHSGEFRADVELGELSSVILALFDGLQIQWLLDPKFDGNAAFGAFSGLLRTYLGAGSGAPQAVSVE